jgi:hypothetical protein
LKGNLLHLLGVNTIARRPINVDDDRPASAAAGLMGCGSGDLAVRRVCSARAFTLDRQAYTVVGILPQGF